MIPRARPIIAIIDMGMGNLFSVVQACKTASLDPIVTRSEREISSADALLLPGVGAFGRAMEFLNMSGLDEHLREAVRTGTPLVGICLGMQILMQRSSEHGDFQGLGILPGEVLRLQPAQIMGRVLKVPEIGWNQVFRCGNSAQDSWAHTPLQGLPNGFFQYFNHSYHIQLTAREMCIATTQFGSSSFCSACSYRNIIGLQFHPERSGRWGIQIYRNLATWIAEAGKR